MPVWADGSLTALAGALSVLFGVLAAMLDRPGPIRLRHWAEEAGGSLRKLYRNRPRFEAFRYLLSALAMAAPVSFFAALTAALARGEGSRPLATAAILTVALIFATQLLDRILVSRNPEKVLRKLTGIYRLALAVGRPVVVLGGMLLPAAAILRQDDEEDEASEDEIEAFLDVGAREGILEPGEEDLIMRVIDFGDAQVRSVMTPRIDIVSAPANSPLDDLANLVIESRHSRIPLCGESVDEVLGVLHIRDLLRGLRRRNRGSATELAMPPLFVPETKPLNDLLRELQAQRQQMAIVVDEYGGTAGLVTVEDLLEEIVGEIVDEHDVEEIICEELDNGGWRLDGMTSLDRLEELFAIELEEEPYETLGGMIFGLLGTVPKPGTVVEAHGLRFSVDRIDERRIEALTVAPLPASRADEPRSEAG